MNKFLHLMTLWLWGGFLYYILEVLWRGHSDPSMFAVGGFCFLLLGGLNNCFPWSIGLVWQAVIGAVVVTAVELISGLILNCWLNLAVWDYSSLPLNLMGQICLSYSLLWVLLSVCAICLDDALRWKLFDEQQPRYRIF